MGLDAPRHEGSYFPDGEPESSALEGGFLATGPPGKPPGSVDTSNFSPKLLVGGPPG